ncbi:hypothetical protein [Dongia sp.]|uniref:hypothetical protein n=1 Tax=Dongia sp. TaxID=1977262 RepID=UPI0035B1D2CD
MKLQETNPPVANDVAVEPAAPVVQLAAFRHRRAKAARQVARQIEALRGGPAACTVSVACRNYMVGREDWCRGIRSLFRTFDCPARVTHGANGSLCLHDLPTGDLVLSAGEVAAVLADGLHIRMADFEADIEASEIRATLPARSRPQLRMSR